MDKVVGIDSVITVFAASITLIYVSRHKDFEGFDVAWDMMAQVLGLSAAGNLS